jgi:TetR/AcrR family transcriptional regulator, transcriptional repressor for nem operon
VLHKALEVFWDKGYHATGMSELEKAMGINKFSIYAEFGSKYGLFLETLDHFTEFYQKPVFNSLASADPKTAISEFLDRALGMASATGHNGCYLLSAGIEFNNSDPAIQERIERLYAFLEERLTAIIQKGGAKGGLAGTLQPRVTAAFLRTYVEGLMSRVRHGAGKATLASGNQVIKAMFERKRVKKSPR